MIDKSKSLANLKNIVWNKEGLESSLAEKCRNLWNVPISKFTTEDFRLLIGQKISLDLLIPVALDILENNPLAQGDLYRGDLLNSVLSVPKYFWLEFPNLNNRLVEVKTEVETLEETISQEILPLLKDFDFK